VFSLALSLVTGNVGGTTKKVIASAVIFVGVAVGNIVGPYAFIESGESTTLRLYVSTDIFAEAPTYTTGIVVCMISRIAEVCLPFVRSNHADD
jgi:hypothetical protein